MAAKIVYYGPGLCGKTTNLHQIYSKTSPQSRGEMVSLETETDRTLFFDLLPIDVGVIGGFKTRLQLYTVPGQVFYNTTRKLVLKGVDGIVFVADSQRQMLEANLESYKNLRENLAEIGLSVDEIPLVIQLNKRDLPNLASPDTILDALDPERRAEYVEAIAANGVGVFETLKLISKLTLRTLRRRMTGEDPIRPAATAPRVAHFRVLDETSRTVAGTTRSPLAERDDDAAAVQEQPAPAAPPSAEQEEQPVQTEATDLRETVAEHVAQEPAPPPAEISATDSAAEPVESAAPGEEPPTATPDAVPPAAVVADPEIEFPKGDEEAEAEGDQEPEVKTVKVRSSVDIMAELESLRKRATQTTAKTPKRDILADLANLRPKRDLHRTLHLQIPADLLPRMKSVRVTLAFEDGDSDVLETRDQQVELGDTSDVQSLSVNVKIDLA